MSDAEAQQVPAVWVGEAEAHRDDAARALAEWARARGVILSFPDAQPQRASIAVDPKIADNVETELAHAHDAQASEDAEERSLARAEALLRAHPELPNAAWLMAEVLRSRRQLVTDPVLATALGQDAAALDGGRVPNIGQASTPLPASYPLAIDAPAGLMLRIDGHAVTAAVLAGEHAVVALRGDRIVYASWVAVRAATTITIPANESPCASFDAVHREGDRIVATGVTCPAWVAAMPGDKPSSVLVARCVQDACSELTSFRIGALATGAPQERDRTKNPWPAWATWTCAGVGAATVLAVVLVASGVLESRPVEQRFVVGGARQE